MKRSKVEVKKKTTDKKSSDKEVKKEVKVVVYESHSEYDPA